MPARCSTVLAVAAVVYDQSSHSEADMAFLDAIAKADREWIDQLTAAKRNWKGDLEVWEITKRLATRQRNEAYAAALTALEAHDFEEDEIMQAAAE